MNSTRSVYTKASYSFCILHSAFCIVAMSAVADVTITDVTARQRWPWNGLVDIDFTISGAAVGDAFAIDVDATYDSGEKTLVAKTFAAEPTAGAGANRVVWDLAADYPEFRASDLRVAVTATPISESEPIYMVIDLSGGPTATKYPVRYTTTPPAHTMGAADEPCQTTELWMRRMLVPDGAFTMNSWQVKVSPSTNAEKNAFWGKLTKNYYIGVFTLTQKQYQLIMGDWPNSYFTNGLHRASRPVEGLKYATYTGTWDDIHASPSSITAASPLGRLRAKTGLPISIPSDTQLCFAHRGGSKLSGGEFYRYFIDGVQAARDSIARYPGTAENTSPDRDCDAKSGTAYVGSYLPNEYGIYDAIGNVCEFTCQYGIASTTFWRDYYKALFSDETIGDTKANPVIDPPGVAEGYIFNNNRVYRRFRSSSWWHSADYQTLWNCGNGDSSYPEGGAAMARYGVRLSMTCE